MNILFVRPRPSPETIGLQHVMVVEPLELEVLAALVQPPDRAVIIDMILEREQIEYFLQRERPDVFCVTGYITHVGVMTDYCRAAKLENPAVRTVVGGVHCEVCPGDFDVEGIDFRVVRNATTVFPGLLRHIRRRGRLPAGVLQRGDRSVPDALPPFDFFFPIPDRSLTERYREKYFYVFHDRVALLKTAFGCPYRCKFCFCRAITNGRYVERPLEEVFAELEQIEEKEIYIVDDDFLVSRTRLERFIEEHHRRGLKKSYLIYGRADFIARNPDLITRFREIGLRTVIVGFESFFDEDLRGYDKGIDARTNREAMRILCENRVDCYATVIVPPHWGKKEFAESKKSMKELGIHYVNLQPLTPLPGTGFVSVGSEILVPRDEYPRWDLAHVVLRPRAMSVARFYREIMTLYNALLFRPAVLRGYLSRYRVLQLWKMLKGTLRVRRQYMAKIREAAKIYA